MKQIFFKSLFAVLFAAATLSLSADPTLVGNSGLKGQTLDGEGAKAVLMGKKTALGDARVVIIIAKAGAAQDTYLQSHVGMTTSQFQNHWRRLFMTGGGSAPKIVETEADAIKLAGETPGGVAIADAAAASALTVLAN